jgi:hypothetical protein
LTLIDAVLALTLLAVLVTFSASALFLSQEAIISSGNRSTANLVVQEAVSALGVISQESFTALGSGTYGLSSQSGHYTLVANSDQSDIFTRQIIITDVDDFSKSVVINISWPQGQQWKSLQSSYVIYNWAL